MSVRLRRRVQKREEIKKTNGPHRMVGDQPLVEVEVELPMVEFLPHMEESIDLANYLGHDQNFSNCNDLPSSMLLPSEAELLHIPTCSTFIDLSDLSDPTDAELYHFYI